MAGHYATVFRRAAAFTAKQLEIQHSWLDIANGTITSAGTNVVTNLCLYLLVVERTTARNVRLSKSDQRDRAVKNAAGQEETMTITRRRVLAGALGAPAIIASTRLGFAAQTLKISHQFPGGTIDEGDFRDRLCLKFAAELAKRTGGEIVAQVYPNSSLMKTIPQFSSLRRGALDLSLYPISYAGGELPETNIGLMPGLVSNYKQGAAWKTAAVGKKFDEFLRSKNVMILSWIWQAGGVVSRGNPIVVPADAKGLKIRGGSREMDMMLQAAGAATLSTPSNELYAAMQTGACDAAITSSTSLISFRLEEVAKSPTTGRGKSY